MIRAVIGGATVVWLALAFPPGAAADFVDGVRAYDSGDYAAAHAAWLPLAQAGDAAAARNLGHLYRTGRGVAKDLVQALRWYRRAAEQGFAGAQANLGVMYARGQGVAANYATAAVWFHRAAVRGHLAAQYNLGLLYENGLGVEPSEEVAMAWYHKAAGAGHQGALERLSQLVAGGVTPKGAEELALDPPAEATEPTDAQSAAVDHDSGKLAVAERLGVGRAAFRAGDYASALEAWRPLAEAGNAWAQFYMGGLYADGTGGPGGRGRGEKVVGARGGTGARQSDPALGGAGARGKRGGPPRCRGRGDRQPGGGRDRRGRVCGRGGRGGDGERRGHGRGRACRLERARAAAAGVAAYRNGDYGAAVAAWLLLAEAGHAWAQFYIGGLYHDGNGMAADLARAHMWWALAARRGHQGARDLMAALEPKMDANALAKAAALTAAWKPRE